MTLTRHLKFAQLALELAGMADNGMTHTLCALVVRKNRILSVGYNSRKTTPRMVGTRMNMWHAEGNAIMRCAEEELDGADLIVARCKPSGKPGLAKPCIICEGLARQCGIRRIVYTLSSGILEMPGIEELRL